MKQVYLIGRIAIIALASALLSLSGCGGAPTTQNNKPIDPSGNWSLKFTDTSNNGLLLAALFSQAGSVVSALNISAAGNTSPFSCVPFAATLSSGQVLNVNQFSGDIVTAFGTIHFSSTLNPQGSHADGTYTLTGNCWGVAANGTFSADEVPSVAGSWSGSLSCSSNCPAGATSGTISATLSQDDATGIVSGTYSISGLPNISSGSISTVTNDLLSGESWQDSLKDNNGNTYTIAGGPLNGLTAGLGLDRSFNGLLLESHDAHAAALATYSVTMSH